MKMKISITVGRRFGKGRQAIYHFYHGEFKLKNDYKERTHRLKALSAITEPRRAKIESLFTGVEKLNLLLTVDKQSINFWFEGVKPGHHLGLVQGRERGKFSPWQASITVK